MSATIKAQRPVTVPCAFCAALNRVDLDRLHSGPKCAECGRPIRLDRPVKVTDANFDRVVADASAPILLDCYADWCGPCRAMAPALDELAHAHTGRALVLKLDTDANPVISQRLGIRGIPTVVAFRGGHEVGRHVGLASLRELEELVR
jgi:thioredoxin 2